MLIEIKRGLVTVASFKANEEVVLTQKLMGEHKITATISVADEMDVRLGDYIEYDGEIFTLNNTPEVSRLGNRKLEYRFEFEGEIYKLYNKIFMDEGAADFSYFGTPEDYLLLLLTNINSIDAGWSLGSIANAEPVGITFNNLSCREALTRIAEEFGLEYFVSGQQISMTERVGQDVFLNLEYGQGKGLYKLERLRLNDQGVITRLYAFGGRKNIDFDYRDGSDRLEFANNPLESNISTYGVVEGSVTFEDIFPNRTGSVSDLPVSGDIFSIFDSSLDFNINDQLLEGTTAKIVFKSGDLAGNQFEIVSYNHTSKRITFKGIVEENDYRLPNEVVKPAIGDEYTLVDIKMPQTYIDAAETELQSKAQAYLDEYDHPRVTYAFTCDEIFFDQNNINITLGDRVRVIDAGLGIDSTLRISELSFPLLYPKRLTTAISEGVEYTTTERIIRITSNTLEQIRTVNRTSNEQARLNQLRLRELQGLIYDPDGYFDTENIRPTSIQTIHLAVGVKSQQFALNGVVFAPNQNAIPSAFAWTGGELVHYEIEETIRTWQIAQGNEGALVDGDAYYIYARVPIVGSQGGIVLDTAARKVDFEAGFYTLLIGVLHSVIDGVRGISLTYGQTEINGKFVRTGTIFSQDGLTYFDLDAGVIGGKIQFEAGSSGYENLSDKPNLGGLAFDDLVGAAKLDNTIIQGGYIKASLIDVNSIIVQGNFATTDNLGDLAFEDLIGLARLDSTIIQGGYIKTSLIDVNTLIVDGGIETEQGAQNKVDDLKSLIDLANPYFTKGVSYWSTNYQTDPSVEDVTDPIINSGSWGGKSIQITGLRILAYKNLIPIDSNRKFKGRFKVRQFIDPTASGESRVRAGVACFDRNGNIIGGVKSFIVFNNQIESVSNWYIFEGEITGEGASLNEFQPNTYFVKPFFLVNLNGDGTAQVDGLEFYDITETKELENSLGDLAFDDLVALAKLDSTIIQGGYIKTSLIDVDTLIARNVLTSPTGRRVHIDGTNNRMRFFNASGTLKLEIDENSGTDPDGNNLTGLICYEGIRSAQVTTSGIVSDNPNIKRSGLHAAIFGLAPFKSGGSTLTAGVMGFSTSSNRDEVFGGYFNTLYAPDFATGIRLGSQFSATSYSLPNSPLPGEIKTIRSQGAQITILGNGHNIVLSNGSTVSSFVISGNKGLILQFATNLWWIIAEN